MKAGEVHVWRIPAADRETAHAALRVILGRFTQVELEFARSPTGKPYLPGTPELKFNLAHGRGMALVGVALEVDVGVDVERVRVMPEQQSIADRFFAPMEAAEYAAVPEGERQREFFRRWTRVEAVLKARGVGLYGAGQELAGEWTVQEIDAGEEFAAAVAAASAGMAVLVHDYRVGAK